MIRFERVQDTCEEFDDKAHQSLSRERIYLRLMDAVGCLSNTTHILVNDRVLSVKHGPTDEQIKVKLVAIVDFLIDLNH